MHSAALKYVYMYGILLTVDEARQLVQKCQTAGRVYAVAQFAGQVPQLELLGMGLSVAGERYFVEIAPDLAEDMTSLFAEDNSVDKQVWETVKTVFADASITKYIHNLKSCCHAGLVLQGSIFDMELIGYLLNPVSSKYDVAELASQYEPSLPVPGKDTVASELYSWQAFALSQIGGKMQELLDKKGLTRLYNEVELPLVEVLASMEANGIFVNSQNLREQAIKVAGKIEDLERDICDLAGQEFNVNSPKQLGEVLFEKLGLPVLKKTKTGYSTNAEVLEQLRGAHPVIEKILSYRIWTKLKSTYLDGISQLINSRTGRVHTSFNQTVTATGRLSSSDPNLQNIPVRREEGKKIRQLFEPGPGYDYLLSADYSQIELRVLADMSEDKSFSKAFNENEDIHARTAAEVFGVDISEVTPQLRRSAKAVNFGIVYGISDYGLSQDLKITRKEAAGYIESYFEKCPGVKAFIDKTVAEAHTNGYVQTLFGRRRDLPAINSSNYNQRMLAERMAMNTPIQGTAADIIKLAMIRAYRMIQEAGLKSRILLQVHDELVLEVVESELEKVKDILKEAMEQVVHLKVPLSIDINLGKNWAEAK